MEYKHKSFTLSVDLLLTIVLVLSILAAVTFGALSQKVTVLQQKVGRLEDGDMFLDKLKEGALADKIREMIGGK